MSRWTFVRRFLLFPLNVLQAVFGAGLVELALPRIQTTQPNMILLRGYLTSVAISLTSGYLIYRKWRRSEVLWVWTVGFLCFGSVFAILYFGDGSSASSLSFAFNQLSGLRCGEDTSSCKDWIVITIPLVRTAGYSAGGWLFAAWRQHGSENGGPTSARSRRNPAN